MHGLPTILIPLAPERLEQLEKSTKTLRETTQAHQTPCEEPRKSVLEDGDGLDFNGRLILRFERLNRGRVDP